MQLSAPDVLTFLLIVAVVILIIVLYHLLFIIIDLRKITERINAITGEIESIAMKPLSIMEESMTWLTEFLMSMYEQESSKKKQTKKKKKKK